MAFGTSEEALTLLKRTVLGALDFHGRSRRTEVIYWWIASALAGMMAWFGFIAFLPFGASEIAMLAVSWIIAIPAFALFARRLHDQDRTGWLALLLPLLLVLSTINTIAFINTPPEAFFTGEVTPFGPFRWLSSAGNLAVLILFLLPGSVGPNRFGNDPRQ